MIGDRLGNAFGQVADQVAKASAHLEVEKELRCGSHTVLVRERLAEGGFGFVDLVSDIFTKKDFVLKRCNVDRDESLQIVKKEIHILQRFAGPYIVELIDSDIILKNKRSREALLLLDFCPGGHLLDRLNSRNGRLLPAESIYRIFGQILLGVRSLHLNNPPITHRDLKLENILFGQDGKVRLCDFGSCVEGHVYVRNMEERQAAEEIIAKETTLIYRSPELVDLYMRDILTEKSDIWALGCIFYALSFISHPFQNAGTGLGILSAKINIPEESSVSKDAHVLIHRMLDFDPEARPTVQQLIDAVIEVAKNRPLPPYNLSAEAAQKRQERMAANELRQKKITSKKPVVAVAPKVALPLSSNSVAAKRLAEKRGQPVTTTNTIPVSAISNNNSNSNSKGSESLSAFQPDDEFDPFAEFPPKNVTNINKSTTKTTSVSSTPTSFAAFDNDPFSNSSDTFQTNKNSVAFTDFFDGNNTSFVEDDPFAFQPTDSKTPKKDFFETNSPSSKNKNIAPAADIFFSDDVFSSTQKTKSLGSRSDSFSRSSVDLLGVEDNNNNINNNFNSSKSASSSRPTSTNFKTISISSDLDFQQESSQKSKFDIFSPKAFATTSFDDILTPSVSSNNPNVQYDIINTDNTPLVAYDNSKGMEVLSLFDRPIVASVGTPMRNNNNNNNPISSTPQSTFKTTQMGTPTYRPPPPPPTTNSPLYPPVGVSFNNNNNIINNFNNQFVPPTKPPKKVPSPSPTFHQYK